MLYSPMLTLTNIYPLITFRLPYPKWIRYMVISGFIQVQGQGVAWLSDSLKIVHMICGEARTQC